MEPTEKSAVRKPGDPGIAAAKPWWRSALSELVTLQRYRFTIEGVSLIAVAVLIGFAAWHSGTNLLYLVFATLIALFLSHGFLVWASVHGLRLNRKLPVHVYAGRPCTVTLTVENLKKWQNSHGLRVTDYGADGNAIGAIFIGCAGKNRTVEETYDTVFATRGLKSLRHLEATTRYPFGLVERGLKQTVQHTLVVYPQVVDIGSLQKNLAAGFGDQEVPEKGIGTELYGLREYVSGEHARHIHWRSSARTGRLMVMEYEKDERRHVTIQLWNVAYGGVTETVRNDFEGAVSLCASLANYYIAGGFEVKLATASGNTAIGQGRQHLFVILRVLAQVELLQHGQERSPAAHTESVIHVRFQDADVPGNPSGHHAVDSRQFKILRGRYVRVDI